MLQRRKVLSRCVNRPEKRHSHLARSHSSEEKRMRETDRHDRKRKIEVLTGRALLLLFGLGVLGFLVAVDRADWFSIRPATGTSIAMAKASQAKTLQTGQLGSDDQGSTRNP
jgi:hypothetical protein